MRADQVEVSWDAGKAKWLVRIANGEEVIRRSCNLPKEADESALRAAAQKTVQDQGYEADAALVSVRRQHNDLVCCWLGLSPLCAIVICASRKSRNV